MQSDQFDKNYFLKEQNLALKKYQTKASVAQRWKRLSAREKEVASNIERQNKQNRELKQALITAIELGKQDPENVPDSLYKNPNASLSTLTVLNDFQQNKLKGRRKTESKTLEGTMKLKQTLAEAAAAEEVAKNKAIQTATLNLAKNADLSPIEKENRLKASRSLIDKAYTQ
jgi:DNA-binding transcriptional regulator GbsR (MarR family)